MMAVFLDRDGVITKSININGKGYAPKILKDFKIFPTAIKAVNKLKKAGFFVFVVTNQPDIGNGLVPKNRIILMHKILKKKMKLDEIVTCPHKQNAKCYCRKPKPGMILSLAKKYKINLKKSFMVGDRAIDIKAGKLAKCRTIYIKQNYIEKKPKDQEATFSTLLEASKYIIKNTDIEYAKN